MNKQTKLSPKHSSFFQDRGFFFTTKYNQEQFCPGSSSHGHVQYCPPSMESAQGFFTAIFVYKIVVLQILEFILL